MLFLVIHFVGQLHCSQWPTIIHKNRFISPLHFKNSRSLASYVNKVPPFNCADSFQFKIC